LPIKRQCAVTALLEKQPMKRSCGKLGTAKLTGALHTITLADQRNGKMRSAPNKFFSVLEELRKSVRKGRVLARQVLFPKAPPS
ncbi:hypothetical protein PCI56_00060, partial [Plesiomonas shigelloides subsp. oncorhynchi]|nr:hypothetical protein [Plesiomonas shigelloides]